MSIKIFEKKRNNIIAKIENINDKKRETPIRFTASFLSFAIRIAVSYLPVEITLIIAVIDTKIANNPNSLGRNKRVKIG